MMYVLLYLTFLHILVSEKHRKYTGETTNHASCYILKNIIAFRKSVFLICLIPVALYFASIQGWQELRGGKPI